MRAAVAQPLEGAGFFASEEDTVVFDHFIILFPVVKEKKEKILVNSIGLAG